MKPEITATHGRNKGSMSLWPWPCSKIKLSFESLKKGYSTYQCHVWPCSRLFSLLSFRHNTRPRWRHACVPALFKIVSSGIPCPPLSRRQQRHEKFSFSYMLFHPLMACLRACYDSEDYSYRVCFQTHTHAHMACSQACRSQAESPNMRDFCRHTLCPCHMTYADSQQCIWGFQPGLGLADLTIEFDSIGDFYNQHATSDCHAAKWKRKVKEWKERKKERKSKAKEKKTNKADTNVAKEARRLDFISQQSQNENSNFGCPSSLFPRSTVRI